MHDPRDRFGHRNRFIKAISSGPVRPVTDRGLIRCHFCGREQELVISSWVRDHFPPTRLSLRESLHWQAIFDGWMVAIAQIYTGAGMVDWDLTLCPACVDQHLERAETVADAS
jgi:hypothetical protein